MPLHHDGVRRGHTLRRCWERGLLRPDHRTIAVSTERTRHGHFSVSVGSVRRSAARVRGAWRPPVARAPCAACGWSGAPPLGPAQLGRCVCILPGLPLRGTAGRKGPAGRLSVRVPPRGAPPSSAWNLPGARVGVVEGLGTAGGGGQYVRSDRAHVGGLEQPWIRKTSSRSSPRRGRSSCRRCAGPIPLPLPTWRRHARAHTHAPTRQGRCSDCARHMDGGRFRLSQPPIAWAAHPTRVISVRGLTGGSGARLQPPLLELNAPINICGDIHG